MSEKDMQAEIDAAAIEEYEADLRGMTLKRVDLEISNAEGQLEEVEMWLEALAAWRRRLVDEGAST